MAKERWFGREILEVVSTEFRDRSLEYYRHAFEMGAVTLNGKVASPWAIIRNGDRLENFSHRHEPPITSKPVEIIQHDFERQFIVVNKPGSIPVHPAGRYHRHTLIEILKHEFGFTGVHPVNRLDRLTSGIMIIPLSRERANQLAKEFEAGIVLKEYVARVKGKFLSEEITCEGPLLTIDRQMGLNIVHPDGKPAKTTFNLIRYDANTDSSVVRCRPFTGRSHQLRVHLQWLGYPIANDPIYSDRKIWGENLGKGGVDVIPEIDETIGSSSGTATDGNNRVNMLPRQTGRDVGMSSPVALSQQAKTIIAKLRHMKDKNDNWSHLRDTFFQKHFAPPHPQNPNGVIIAHSLETPAFLQKHFQARINRAFCPDCLVPLPPDPKPEALYIFLHALKYTVPDFGTFQTKMPRWAAAGWTWE